MMKSIFERDLISERIEIEKMDLSEIEYQELKENNNDNLSFQKFMIKFDDLLKRKDISKDIKRIQFDLIFEIFWNNEYIQNDYFNQKMESKKIDLSFEEYQEELFLGLMNGKFSLREIF